MKNQMYNSQVSKVPFKSLGIYLSPTASGFTGGSLDLILANLSTRLAAMALLYKRWRFSKALRVKIYPDYVPVSQNNAGTFANYGFSVAAAFYGAPAGAVGAAVNSLSDLAEMLHSADAGAGRAASFSVPVKVLREAANAPWNMTSVGSLTSAGEDANNGCIFYGINLQGTTTNTTRVWMELSGEVELCEPTEPSVSFLRVLADHLERGQDGRGPSADYKGSLATLMSERSEAADSLDSSSDSGGVVLVNETREESKQTATLSGRRLSACPLPLRRQGRV